MEVVRGQGPNDFDVPARVIVGSGDDAIYDPEMQEDLVLVDPTQDTDSTEVKPYMDEDMEAHRQREETMCMAAEDKIYPTADAVTGSATAAPAPKPKAKKRTRNN